MITQGLSVIYGEKYTRTRGRARTPRATIAPWAMTPVQKAPRVARAEAPKIWIVPRVAWAEAPTVQRTPRVARAEAPKIWIVPREAWAETPAVPRALRAAKHRGRGPLFRERPGRRGRGSPWTKPVIEPRVEEDAYPTGEEDRVDGLKDICVCTIATPRALGEPGKPKGDPRGAWSAGKRCWLPEETVGSKSSPSHRTPGSTRGRRQRTKVRRLVQPRRVGSWSVRGELSSTLQSKIWPLTKQRK